MCSTRSSKSDWRRRRVDACVRVPAAFTVTEDPAPPPLRQIGKPKVHAHLAPPSTLSPTGWKGTCECTCTSSSLHPVGSRSLGADPSHRTASRCACDSGCLRSSEKSLRMGSCRRAWGTLRGEQSARNRAEFQPSASGVVVGGRARPCSGQNRALGLRSFLHLLRIREAPSARNAPLEVDNGRLGEYPTSGAPGFPVLPDVRATAPLRGKEAGPRPDANSDR